MKQYLLLVMLLAASCTYDISGQVNRNPLPVVALSPTATTSPKATITWRPIPTQTYTPIATATPKATVSPQCCDLRIEKIGTYDGGYDAEGQDITLVSMDEAKVIPGGTIGTVGLDGCIAALVVYKGSAAMAHFHWNDANTEKLLSELFQNECGLVFLAGGYAEFADSIDVVTKISDYIAANKCLRLASKDHILGTPSIRSLFYDQEAGVITACDGELTTYRSYCTEYSVPEWPENCPGLCQC